MSTLTLTDIYQLLPKDKYLPEQPLLLTPEEEITLEHEIERALKSTQNVELVLKRTYLELANRDSKLTGFVHFSHLSSTLTRNGVCKNREIISAHLRN